ncbi:MAG: lmo0937 family membrane protein [Sphingomonadaceae bacterium]|nr:lmo0937 family membrane protein [Sphingomonadaceae bacterium]
MWIGIAVVLIVIWLVSFVALHVSSALIHLLLLIALISLVLHFVRGRSTV